MNPERSLLKTHWYRLLFALAIIGPALCAQTVAPLIPERIWERLAEDLYAWILRPAPAAPGNSSVVMLEIDQKTINAYGWPIDRNHYVKVLQRLREAGHPWVLSLLQFQSLVKPTDPPELQEAKAATDRTLAQAIRDYRRYVGTGLEARDGSVLDLKQEEELLPRVLLSSRGLTVDDLPELPLRFAEDDQFVDAQAAFGPGAGFGTEPVIHCGQMYITDAAHSGLLLLPSSLVWSAALAQNAGIRTSTGASWPRADAGGSATPSKHLQVAYQQCVGTPGILTADYLQRRGIERFSMHDFLTTGSLPDLTGKIVVLAHGDMRKYRGPGVETSSDSGIVEEHVLAARLLDEVLAGTSIRRDPLRLHAKLAWAPLAVAGIFGLLSLVVQARIMAGVAALGVAVLIGVGAWFLHQGVFVLPIQALTSALTTCTALLGLHLYLRYHNSRRLIRFARRMNRAYSQCNTFSEIESKTRELCRSEFKDAHVAFGCVDRDLYEASSDPHAALALLARQHAATPSEPEVEEQDGTQLTRVRRPLGFGKIPGLVLTLNVQQPIDSKIGRLGVFRVEFAYAAHETQFVHEMLDSLRAELTQHWHRIRLLVDQKLLDYKFLMEQSRGDIMKRFLTQSLVARFSDARTMEENLHTVLTPRSCHVALLQADIRGYSQVSAMVRPEEMLRVVQSYFREVVDAATRVAQVKLIGDCIFLFIEEEAASDDASPTDLALELAAILVRETINQNKLRAQESIPALNFGLAIHYGEVVVGNLSSEHCIDYTVIGANVNFVARLEELTKNQALTDRLGTNALLLSDAALASLKRYRHLHATELKLSSIGLAVRSFANVTHVYGLPAATLLEMDSRDSHDPSEPIGRQAG